MPISGQERSAYHGVCTSTKRPYQGQNKSSVKSDKAAADFLFTCRSCGNSVLSGHEKPIGSSIAAILMVTIMLPFFFMAMYEKDGLPFEKVVANIIRQKFICPAVRPYKTENFYQEISTLVKRRVSQMAKRQSRRLSRSVCPWRKKKPSGKKKQNKQKRKRTGKA